MANTTQHADDETQNRNMEDGELVEPYPPPEDIRKMLDTMHAFLQNQAGGHARAMRGNPTIRRGRGGRWRGNSEPRGGGGGNEGQVQGRGGGNGGDRGRGDGMGRGRGNVEDARGRGVGQDRGHGGRDRRSGFRGRVQRQGRGRGFQARGRPQGYWRSNRRRSGRGHGPYNAGQRASIQFFF